MSWLQLGYQYGIGGLFLGVSLALCFQKGGAELGNRADRRAFWISIIGFFLYLGFHTGWILLTA